MTNYTDKTVAVTIHNVAGWTLEPVMLAAVMKRITERYSDQAYVIDVYPQERVPADAPAYRHPGLCEWTLRIHTGTNSVVGGTWFTLGAIQRSPDAEVEFHS